MITRTSGLAALLFIGVAAPGAHPPELVRIYPLGGQAGTTVSLEILGSRLSNVIGVMFDSQELVWDQKTAQGGPVKATGNVRIAPTAALGAHTLRVITLDGPSTSAIFNVGQFPSPKEVEPNDKLESAQRIPLPVEVQGRLDGAPDRDIYSFTVNKGERWVFDLRSIEEGSAVEARMILMDATGKRIDFNDDRDDYNENPLIEHTFSSGGIYHVKLDQYRGPRGFNFGKNCSYTLRISALPLIKSTNPMAVRRGSSAVVHLAGSGLDSVQKVYLTELREAEYARMTYPYTIPIHFRPDPVTSAQQVRLDGHVKRRSPGSLEVTFPIPATAPTGIWRLWAVGAKGSAAGLNMNVVDESVIEETSAARSNLTAPVAVNGELSKPGEKDTYRIQGHAGQPLHFWTVAAQLGVPFLDSVLTLRDASGKKIAENDDVVAGQGTLLGNPDSSLFFTPAQDGLLSLEVSDRIRRGGPGFEYCLKVHSERPSFQLFTTPENLTVTPGSTTEIKVHLVREAGFEGEVNIWFDGLPPGVTAPRGQFRADQLFEPNADGADMIIPEITFEVKAPPSIAEGIYPIRAYGAPAREAAEKRVIEAHATMMQGPLLDLWNFVRRPVPAILLTVVQPFTAELQTRVRTLGLERGKSATIELTAENVPEGAPFRLLDLPNGVQYRLLGRQGSQMTISLEASAEAPVGTYDISAEADVGRRKAPSPAIALSIQNAVPASR